MSCTLALLAACTSSNTQNNGNCTLGCSAGLSCIRNSDFPAGICSADCSSNASACPSGTVCSPLLASGSKYCLQTCAGATCSDSTVCSASVDGPVCLAAAEPVAVPISCAAPRLVIGTPAGPASRPACQTPVVASGLAPGDIQLLGNHAPGAQVSFQVPAGATGFTVVSQAVAGQNAFVDCQGQVVANVPLPTPILVPGGAVFYNALLATPPDLPSAELFYTSVAGQQPYTAALTFPNTSAGLALAMDGGLPGGQWSFEVNDFANALGPLGCDGGTARNTYDVQVVVAPGPFPSTAQLNVDIYLVSTTLTAANSVSNAGVGLFATRLGSVFANAGVCVGTLTFHDVPTWAKNAYASVDVDDPVVQNPCSDFRQMFTLAEPGRSMALFFVDDMQSSGQPANSSIVGKDGTIPGMATYNGTIAGGSAVLDADLTATTGCGTAINLNCGPDRVALIAAHETGHFLGLFHTSEHTGDEFDPLVDTPTCVCALCATAPGAAANCSDGGQATLVDQTVCAGTSQQCGGTGFLMFWLLNGNLGLISPEQGAVMRANPLLSAP